MEVLSSLFLLEKHDIPKGVTLPKFDVLKKSTVFSKFELKRMFARFCTLCIDNNITSGIVDKSTFLLQPEVSFCFLVDLAFDYESSRHALLPDDPKPLTSTTVPVVPPVDNATKILSPNDSCKGLDFEQFVSFFNEFSALRTLDQKLNCK